MKLLITIYPDQDGVFIAECPSIPGCVSQGKTEEEAEQNIRDAIKECLEVRAEKGLPLTVTTRDAHLWRRPSRPQSPRSGQRHVAHGDSHG
jgi:predicted RNase H-like HicB family nuclease